MLQKYTGDPEEVQAAAITWNRIATEWDEVATRIESDVNNDLNAQDCLTIRRMVCRHMDSLRYFVRVRLPVGQCRRSSTCSPKW